MKRKNMGKIVEEGLQYHDSRPAAKAPCLSFVGSSPTCTAAVASTPSASATGIEHMCQTYYWAHTVLENIQKAGLVRFNYNPFSKSLLTSKLKGCKPSKIKEHTQSSFKYLSRWFLISNFCRNYQSVKPVVTNNSRDRGVIILQENPWSKATCSVHDSSSSENKQRCCYCS